MRLHVLSDLHLEHGDPPPAPAEADVVVLAGDIGVGEDGVAWARDWVGERPALYVAGNHEFYGHSFPGLLEALRARAAGSTVRVLENDVLILDGVRFLGCTLWSDFDFAGPEQRARSMKLSRRLVNDFGQIRRAGAEAGLLVPSDVRAWHLESRAWLSERLAEPFAGPTVVVTHHQPLIRARPPHSLMAAIAGAFASDVTELMGGGRVDLWIYGHTHRAADLDVGGTRLISNPRGYPHQPVAGFDPGFVVELG
ncbi:MAG TPA: metallophosphoesterase [Solirubrobacteraceae bacterium]|nr:metallophosphoesterase [Solirubrobacteraceae bacterium]